MTKHALITICGRAGSKGVKSKNLRDFCGEPIVYFTLSAAELFIKARPDVEVDICLNTDSPELAEIVAARYPEVVFLERTAELSGDEIQKETIYRDCVARMEAKTGRHYECMIDLDITSPLRRADDLVKTYEMFEADSNCDVALSAAPARRNPYFNMGQRGENGYARRVIENRNTARQQAPECYDYNASLYVFDRDFIVERMTFDLWQGNMLSYLMYDTGILDIDSEDDFELIEVIGKFLFDKHPEFGAVRDNIREK